MSNYVDMMKRQTRNHPGLEWEGENLQSQFVDINRVALDDKYGKVAAPLTKRQNGTGPAGRDAPAGLFGILPVLDQSSKRACQIFILIGFATGLAVYHFWWK